MRYFIFVFLSLLSSIVWTQNVNFKFRGTITDQSSGSKLDGVLVEMIQNGSTIAKATTSKGKYTLGTSATLKKILKVRFSKNGLVSKFIQFDFRSANEEDLPAGDFQPVQSLDVTLFKKKSTVDFSFLNSEPVAKIGYDDTKLEQKLDADYNKKMRLKVGNLLTQAQKEDEQNDIAYNEAIKKADASYDAKKYEEALSFYTQAIKIKPKEDHPAQRILEIDALLQAEKESELADKQENQAYYNLIEAADNLRDAGQLDKAIEKYDEALDLKDEQYPRDEIKKIESAKKYDKAIEQGDIFLGQKSYKTALDKFKLASKLKPTESYPKQKIGEIEKLLKADEEKKEIKKQYDDAIIAADQLFQTEQYEKAKLKYEEALTFESSSSYAKGRIGLCDEKLAEAKEEAERLAKIQELLKKGNELFSQEKYKDAKNPFSEVLTLDAENAEAKDKIAQIEQKIKEAEDKAKIEEQYSKLLDEGNTAFSSEDYASALSKYQEAKSVKSTEEVDQKITETQAEIAEQEAEAKKNAELAAQEESYQKLLSEGNTAFGSEDYASALSKYQEAKAVKSTEEVDQKITETQAKIAEQEAEAKKNAELAAQEESYQKLLSEGNTAFSSEDYASALSKYQEAKVVKSTEEVDQKITETQAKIAEQEAEAQKNAELAAQEESYQKLLIEGNTAFSSEDYASALSKYQEAKAVKSTEEVDQKITDTQAKIAEQEAEAQKNAELAAQEESYQKLLSEGNTAFSSEDYASALSKYQEAKEVKSTEEVDQKITETQAKIAEQEAEVKKNAELAAQEESYQKLLSEGNTAFSSEDYASALSKYQEAKSVKSTEEIDQKITETQAKIVENNSLAEKQAQYNQLISEGESLLSSGDLSSAKSKFTGASSLFPEEQLPKDKIQEIESLLEKQGTEAQITALLEEGASLISSEQLEQAKSKFQAVLELDDENQSAKDRIVEIDELIALRNQKTLNAIEINKLLDEGSALFDGGFLVKAKSIYEQILSKDMGNPTAISKIAEIEKLLKEKSESAELDKRYEALLQEADKEEKSENWETSLAKYQEASSLKPDESFPKQKITELSSLIAANKNEAEKNATFERLKSEGKELFTKENYQGAKTKLTEALSYRQDEEVQQLINQIDQKIAEMATANQNDQEYNLAIESAQKSESANLLEKAIEEYQRALSIKPEETLPPQKIAELQSKLDDIAANEKALNEKYNKALSEGNRLFDEKNYLDAIKEYNKANQLKPKELEPIEKAKLAQQKAQEENDDENRVYEKILNAAQDKINQNDLANAKELAKRAEKMRPEDTRPKDLLSTIENLVKKKKQYDDLMSKAFSAFTDKKYDQSLVLYKDAKALRPSEQEPKDKIAEIEEILNNIVKVDPNQVRYDELMQKGKLTETAKRYEEALNFYQKALGVFPERQEAKDKVAEMQQILNDILAKESEKMAQKSKFDALIKEADLLFEQKKYVPEAKNKYEEALAIFPNNSYAKTQYDLSIEKGAKQQESEKYQQILADADKNFTNKNYTKSKELYQSAITLNSNDDYPKQRLIEIDAILNPPFVQSDELEDLGDPFSGSIIDGDFILKKAEERRENQKKSNVLAAEKSSIQQMEKINSEKIAQRNQTVNRIYKVLDKIDMTTKDSDESRLRVIELLRESEKNRQTLKRQNNTFEKSENWHNQGTLDVVKTETRLDYKEDESVYQENTADLSEIKIKEQQMTHGKVVGKITDNYQADRELYLVQNQVSERKMTDQQISHDNKEEMKGTEEIVFQTNKNQSNAQRSHSLDMDESIERVKEKVIEDASESKEKQFQSNQRFASIVNEKEEKDLADNNEEIEKYRRNTQSITNEKEKLKDVKQKADLAMAGKIAYVEQQDKKARTKSQENNLSDLEERLNAQKSIENTALTLGNKAKAEEEKHVETRELVKDVDKSINVKQQGLKDDLTNKAYKASAVLSKVDNKPKAQAKAKNSLGEEFPEGVSQQIYTRKGEDGLVSTVITRRIVVKNGHADVYIRTQTPTAITYTKNGNASLSHVWNKETQGPHLVRNY